MGEGRKIKTQLELAYKLLLGILHYSTSILVKKDFKKDFSRRNMWYANGALKVLHEIWRQNSSDDALYPQGFFFNDCENLFKYELLSNEIQDEEKYNAYYYQGQAKGRCCILLKTKIEVKRDLIII